MYEVQPKDTKRPTDLMIMMDLKETKDYLAMTNNICWHGPVLWEEGRVLRRVLSFENADQQRKWRLKKICKRQVK